MSLGRLAEESVSTFCLPFWLGRRSSHILARAVGEKLHCFSIPFAARHACCFWSSIPLHGSVVICRYLATSSFAAQLYCTPERVLNPEIGGRSEIGPEPSTPYLLTALPIGYRLNGPHFTRPRPSPPHPHLDPQYRSTYRDRHPRQSQRKQKQRERHLSSVQHFRKASAHAGCAILHGE